MKVITVQILQRPFLPHHQTLLLETLAICFSFGMGDQIFIQTQNSRQNCSFICINIYAYM